MANRALVLGLLGAWAVAAQANPRPRVRVALQLGEADGESSFALLVDDGGGQARRVGLGGLEGRCGPLASPLGGPLVGSPLLRYGCALPGQPRPFMVVVVGREGAGLVVRQGSLHFAHPDGRDRKVGRVNVLELARVPLSAGAAVTAVAPEAIESVVDGSTMAALGQREEGVLAFDLFRPGQDTRHVMLSDLVSCDLRGGAAYQAAMGKPLAPPVVSAATCAETRGQLNRVFEVVRAKDQLLVKRTDLVTDRNPVRRVAVMARFALAPGELVVAPVE